MTARTTTTNRSRITNGALFPPGVDGRSAEARRFRDLHREFATALPPGPRTVTQDARLRTLVGLTLALERIGAQQARGMIPDPAELVALSNAQGRLLAELGLTAPAPQSEPDPVAEHRKRMGWAP